jgi:hypothetical protein
MSKVPAHHFLYFLISEEVAFREGAHDIVIDEFEYFFLLRVLLETRVLDVGVDHNKIFLAFALEGRLLVFLVSRHVFEQQLPSLGAQI